jgi:HAD superfamily hydrolase (TIGR01450 family)
MERSTGWPVPIAHIKSMNTESAAHRLAHTAAARLAQAEHLIVDLDGTLIREHEVLAGAAQLLRRFDGRYVVVSNNSTHSPDSLSRKLHRMGLKVAPQALVLAGEQTLAYLRREHPKARIFLSGSRALQQMALAMGCDLVRDEAEVVVLALDPHFNVARLTHIVNQLRRGALLVVANADATHPGPRGSVVPQTGALLAAVRTASGVAPHRIIGKPGPLLLAEGMRRLSARADGCVLIGDNPDTDGLGARAMGMACILVGAHERADVPELAALWRPAVVSGAAESCLSSV